MKPRGSQPDAIKKLVEGFQNNQQYQTLLGVTGSGKTFTMANVIQQVQKPTLVLAHNKTLAAQLFSEFKELIGGGNAPKNSIDAEYNLKRQKLGVQIQQQEMKQQHELALMAREDKKDDRKWDLINNSIGMLSETIKNLSNENSRRRDFEFQNK